MRNDTLNQLSITRDESQYGNRYMSAPVLGVVLNLRYADDPETRTARMRTDWRGYVAEADVYVPSMTTVLHNVVIAPSHPSGLDNFEESLPRPSSALVNGEPFDSNLSGVNPADLDGDWCVVHFLNGFITTPFVTNWWPHPRNPFDPATSGKGNPLPKTTTGTALDQSGRFFRRINGVEYVVTKDGNLWLSTTRAGSSLLMNTKSVDGRFPRADSATGGGIYVSVKPTQALELTWDPQVDGIGSGATYDPQLPQRNPGIRSVKPVQVATNVKFDATNVTFYAPATLSITTEALTKIETLSFVVSSDIMTVDSTTSVSISSPSISETASSTLSQVAPVITRTASASITDTATTSIFLVAPTITIGGVLTVTPDSFAVTTPNISMGPLQVSSALSSISSLVTNITSATVNLGTGTLTPVALASLVTAELAKIATAISGLGGTYVPAPVAATMVNAI